MLTLHQDSYKNQLQNLFGYRYRTKHTKGKYTLEISLIELNQRAALDAIELISMSSIHCPDVCVDLYIDMHILRHYPGSKIRELVADTNVNILYNPDTNDRYMEHHNHWIPYIELNSLAYVRMLHRAMSTIHINISEDTTDDLLLAFMKRCWVFNIRPYIYKCDNQKLVVSSKHIGFYNKLFVNPILP